MPARPVPAGDQHRSGRVRLALPGLTGRLGGVRRLPALTRLVELAGLPNLRLAELAPHTIRHALLGLHGRRRLGLYLVGPPSGAAASATAFSPS